MLSISSDTLRKMLNSAYEEGWAGCLELKREYVESVMESVTKTQDLSNSSTVTVSPAIYVQPESDVSTFMASYYPYVGQTSHAQTFSVEDVDANEL